MSGHLVTTIYETSEFGTRISFSRAEAGRLLGCSAQSVARAVERGELVAVQIGERILIPAWSLDRLMGIRRDEIETQLAHLKAVGQ